MTPAIWTPRPWQPDMIDWILDRPRCAIWAGMGLGKGSVTYTALHYLSLTEDIFPVLVIGPLRVARKVWSEEAAKWAHLSHLRVSTITGTAKERAAALLTPAEIYTTNYENLPWLVPHLDCWHFRAVIADEARALKSFRLRQGGARARALQAVAHTTPRWINLTGTPAPNGLLDLWGQTWFLDKGQRLGRTYGGFTNRWFRRKPGAAPDAYGQVEPLPHAAAEVHAALRDICLSVEPPATPEPIHNIVRVDLPKSVRTLYRDMERKMFMQVKEHGISAVNAAARTIKCLQIANGAAYVDPDVTDDDVPAARQWVALHDEKIDALREIVDEAGGPVLVAYQFKSDLARLLKAFPEGRHLHTERDEDDFKAGKIQVLFAHPKSAGHGIDGFQYACHNIAFFGQWWDLELRQQIIARIGPVRQMQSGLNRPVIIHDIVADRTVDELVLERHESKRSVQDLLLEATRRSLP